VQSLTGLPVWIWERPDGTTAYGAPPAAGPDGGVKAAVHHSTSRPGGEWPAADVAALLAGLLPGLGDRVLRSVDCTYTLTPDAHAVVGRHPAPDPGTAPVVVACGFSGHGFKLTPVLGEVLADLVVDGRTAYDLSLLDPLR
jgi:sarcosine oxidase